MSAHEGEDGIWHILLLVIILAFAAGMVGGFWLSTAKWVV
jgi:uncharacterized protein YneF (UPF0154 family)